MLVKKVLTVAGKQMKSQNKRADLAFSFFKQASKQTKISCTTEVYVV